VEADGGKKWGELKIKKNFGVKAIRKFQSCRLLDNSRRGLSVPEKFYRGKRTVGKGGVACRLIAVQEPLEWTRVHQSRREEEEFRIEMDRESRGEGWRGVVVQTESLRHHRGNLQWGELQF